MKKSVHVLFCQTFREKNTACVSKQEGAMRPATPILLEVKTIVFFGMFTNDVSPCTK